MAITAPRYPLAATPVGSYTGSLNASPTGIAFDVAPDRTTMYGYHIASGRIGVSTDEGATWTAPNATSFPGGISGVRRMYDGELLVHAGVPDGSTPGHLWRSTGWASNPATATFAIVRTALGSSQAYFSTGWGYSQHGPFLLVNEYGPKNSSTDLARYSHYSRDGGVTWASVFDLYTQLNAIISNWDGSSAHLHGAAYDPWWDALWVCNGDFGGVVPPNVWLSLDRGTTWSVVYNQHQFTSILCTPTAILFVSDAGSGSADGHGNGVFKIARTATGRTATHVVTAADEIDTNSVLTVVGNRGFWLSPWEADSLALFSLGAGPIAGPSRLIATRDGTTFTQIWTDGGSYTDVGLKTMVGPTVSGKILGFWQSGGTFKSLVLTPT